MKVLHLARNVRYITFTMRTNTKRTPCFLFLPPILSATRARGSHDLRPRVTRPAPAGHTTCARGSRDLRPRVADFVPKRNGKWPSETGNKFYKTKVRQCGTGTGSGGTALSERETMCGFICGLGTAEHCSSP